jgi:hypothetical protein
MLAMARYGHFLRKPGGDEPPMLHVSQDGEFSGREEMVLHDASTATKDNRVAMSDN